jgi:hypothetical protein
MKKSLLLIGLLLVILPSRGAAEAGDRNYVAGIRSGLITGTMKLSGLDPVFADLAPDGPTGPHMSGFFFLFKVRPYLRLGVETLVANSDQNAATTMNYQAAGPVAEFTYGKSWFVSGGLHVGGVIVNAMARQGAAPAKGASTGSYFKGNGLFVAPSVDVGYRYRRTEIGAFAKQVSIFGEQDRGGISAFSSTFAGLRFGVAL